MIGRCYDSDNRDADYPIEVLQEDRFWVSAQVGRRPNMHFCNAGPCFALPWVGPRLP